MGRRGRFRWSLLRGILALAGNGILLRVGRAPRFKRRLITDLMTAGLRQTSKRGRQTVEQLAGDAVRIEGLLRHGAKSLPEPSMTIL